MPVHVLPNRRTFLASVAATVGGVACGAHLLAADAEKTDANRIALLSDTHIPHEPTVENRSTNMTANLKSVVAQLCGQTRFPAHVMVNGDCAFLKGLPADYANFAGLVAPLAEKGMPLHVTMGNHDDREPLYHALASQRPGDPPVKSKHVSVIELAHANWFLLDTLTKVDFVTGEVGEDQLGWLEKELDRRATKPAIIMAHHNPQFMPPKEGQNWGGIKDTEAVFKMLASKAHVKAFVFGHTHVWKMATHEKIHLVNLPPVAYVFADDQPNGWVDAVVHETGLKLTLHTHDPKHPKSGEVVDLKWM